VSQLKSILMLANPFYGYFDSVRYGFQENDISCDVIVYKPPNKILFKLFRWLKLDYSILLNKQRKIIKNYVLNNFKKYDVVLLFGFYIYEKEDLKEIKDRTKLPIVFWLFDSFYNPNFSISNNYSEYIDYYFCYNEEDVLTLTRIGKAASFLPLAYDSRNYKILRNKELKYDIYFIGSLRPRIEFLNKYLEMIDDKNYKIRIDGYLTPVYTFFTRNKYKYFYKYYTGKKLNHKEINEIYNSTRICLNLQPSQATSGFSIRTYEILGSGGFQLTNGNKELIRKIFKDENKIVHFKDMNELVMITNKILSINQSVTNKIINKNIYKHNFINRCKSIKNVIEKRLLNS